MSMIVNKDLVSNTPKDWADLKSRNIPVRSLSPAIPRASNQAHSRRSRRWSLHRRQGWQ